MRLGVTKTGAGAGTVQSSPSGISCGSDCASRYNYNTTITLTATAAAGSVFAGWSASCGGTAASTKIVLKSKSTCTATFNKVSTPPPAGPYSLSVAKAGAGTGTVSSSPAGIACGSTCTYSYAANTSVALTATPAAGSTFSGWSGNCSGTAATSQIVVNANSSCTATFAATQPPPPTQATLWVTPSGAGTGTVTSSPAGINCGGTCSASYALNSSVSLSAVANTGSVFAGWTGSCSGSAANTQITLAANSTCYATFNANTVPSSGARYISPGGNNAADGLTPGTAWKTFAKAFSSMTAGGELILLDGNYSVASGTGYISYLGTNSGQPPSGSGLNTMTYIHAQNPGKVTVTGELFIGRSTRKDSYIKIQGITFVGGGTLYNTSFVTIKDSGFNGAFGIGTNDHANGNTDNLIEDVWVWAAEQRIIAINYQADRNVWRRILVRGDGCSTAECTGSGNPNVGFTVYDSSDVSVQNVLVVDRILSAAARSAGNDYADFASAQHTASAARYLGRNKWLGSMSINAPDSGFWFEADYTIAGATTWTLQDVVALGKGIGGINVGSTGPSVISNATLINLDQTNDGLRVAPGSPGGSVNNLIVKGFNRGLNSYLKPAYTDTFGSAQLYNQTTPTVGVRTTNPQADGTPASLKYPVRVEAGSILKSSGLNGADTGANVIYRYGVDGSRFGDAGYEALGTKALWPWPNQARIKQEMCAATARGFCSTAARLDGQKAVSVTSYVWEQLGSPVPVDIDP
ncbi:MAG: InlB B-repeat-containing protein [Betaproteobacteria bacterium]